MNNLIPDNVMGLKILKLNVHVKVVYLIAAILEDETSRLTSSRSAFCRNYQRRREDQAEVDKNLFKIKLVSHSYFKLCSYSLLRLETVLKTIAAENRGLS